MFSTGLTDGLHVAAQHAPVPALLLLDVVLHVAERCVHPLGEGVLHVTVVLLHLHRRNTTARQRQVTATNFTAFKKLLFHWCFLLKLQERHHRSSVTFVSFDMHEHNFLFFFFLTGN